MNVVEVKHGDSPVILGFPHTGTEFPPAIWNRLNDNGRLLADTDWHLHTLYAGLLPGTTTVRATFGRYVIDANRDPTGTSLYPGQNTTGLVPHRLRRSTHLACGPGTNDGRSSGKIG